MRISLALSSLVFLFSVSFSSNARGEDRINYPYSTSALAVGSQVSTDAAGNTTYTYTLTYTAGVVVLTSAEYLAYPANQPFRTAIAAIISGVVSPSSQLLCPSIAHGSNGPNNYFFTSSNDPNNPLCLFQTLGVTQAL